MTQPKRVFILLGPPGAGKGTQAQQVADAFNLFHIDTGQALRNEIASGSEPGKVAKQYMDKGQLVPIELVTEVIKACMLRISPDQSGYLFDGFPRNAEQAKGMKKILDDLNLKIDAVLYLNIPYETLMDRLAYRVTCTKCSVKYNLKLNPPTSPNACDLCSGELVVRPDDHPEIIEHRLKAYNRETAPLIDFYRNQGLLREIDASKPIDKVFEDLHQQIGQFFHPSDTMLV